MATRKKSTRSIRPQFPNRPSDDKAVEHATQVLRVRYLESATAMAAEILRDAASQYSSFEDAQDYINQQIHEAVDGSSLVLVTREALNTLVQSQNWLEIDEMGAEQGEGLVNTVTIAAYYALRADVTQIVEELSDEFFTEDDDD